MTEEANPILRATHNCGYCGNETDDYHSGVWECGSCWNWRKLDGPAARHWNRVVKEFLSNVDMYDFMDFFPAVFGNKDDGGQMIHFALELEKHTDAVLAMTPRQRAMGPQGKKV